MSYNLPNTFSLNLHFSKWHPDPQSRLSKIPTKHPPSLFLSLSLKQTLRQDLTYRIFMKEHCWDQHLWRCGKSRSGQREKEVQLQWRPDILKQIHGKPRLHTSELIHHQMWDIPKRGWSWRRGLFAAKATHKEDKAEVPLQTALSAVGVTGLSGR